MSARLIINADDFGISHGVNRAIGELAAAGAISSATLMAGSAGFDDAVATARKQPQLGVGCHLVFVDGRPLSSPDLVQSLLANDGVSFRASLYDFAQASLLGRISAEEIEAETMAQIMRLQAAGVAVTHIDTHKHTHAFAVVARGVLRGAARCGVWRCRFPFEPRWSRLASREECTTWRRLQSTAMQQMEKSFTRVARDFPRINFSGGTLGILATGALNLGLLETLCAGARDCQGDTVLELCVHPGHVDDGLISMSTRLLESREIEYQALMQLASNKLDGIKLIHYGQLAETNV